MTSGVASVPFAQVDTPLLAVALAQGSAVPASLADFDRATGGIVARAITSGDFKGKRDETTLLYLSGAKPERVAFADPDQPARAVDADTIQIDAPVKLHKSVAPQAKDWHVAIEMEAAEPGPTGADVSLSRLP